MPPSDEEEDEAGRWRDFSGAVTLGESEGRSFTIPWRKKKYTPAKWWEWYMFRGSPVAWCPDCAVTCLGNPVMQRHEELHLEWDQEGVEQDNGNAAEGQPAESLRAD